ncbi:hypothetical protein WCLP8_3600005 [uncultured Gammaproteobacteria bacterium]
MPASGHDVYENFGTITLVLVAFGGTVRLSRSGQTGNYFDLRCHPCIACFWSPVAPCPAASTCLPAGCLPAGRPLPGRSAGRSPRCWSLWA